jgi:hypothetical protein
MLRKAIFGGSSEIFYPLNFFPLQRCPLNLTLQRNIVLKNSHPPLLVPRPCPVDGGAARRDRGRRRALFRLGLGASRACPRPARRHGHAAQGCEAPLRPLLGCLLRFQPLRTCPNFVAPPPGPAVALGSQQHGRRQIWGLDTTPNKPPHAHLPCRRTTTTSSRGCQGVDVAVGEADVSGIGER